MFLQVKLNKQPDLFWVQIGGINAACQTSMKRTILTKLKKKDRIQTRDKTGKEKPDDQAARGL